LFWILKFNTLLQSEGTLAYDVVKTHDITDAERLTTEQHVACKIKQSTFPFKNELKQQIFLPFSFNIFPSMLKYC